MKNLTERRLGVFEDMISFYNLSTRGFDINCCYLTNDGKKCAIGRLIPDELALRLEKECGGDRVAKAAVFTKLPTEIQELGSHFLTLLQNLHDVAQNWDKTGLTSLGNEEANAIRQWIQNETQ